MSEQLNSATSHRSLICGTASYMAPEVFDEHTCLESDIWSLGITAIELAEGKHPYESHSIMRIMKRISTEAPPSLSSSRWSADFVDFVRQCLTKEPAERPKASSLLQVVLFLSCYPSTRSSRTPWRASRTADSLPSSASLPSVRATPPLRQRRPPQQCLPQTWR